jgi:hypothetical protein
VMDSLGAERLEETGASRPGELINSLREGLLAYPLEALMKILPEGFSFAPCIGSPGELAEAILHSQLQVSFMPNFLYPLFSLSHFFFQGIIRSVAFWQNYQEASASQASLAAKVAEMQFRIDELEFDVCRTEDLESQIETLKNEIQLRDRTIEARDKDMILARKQAKEAHVQADESEKTLDRVLTNLTEANERKAAMTA